VPGTNVELAPVEFTTDNGTFTVHVAVVSMARKKEAGLFGLPLDGLGAELRLTAAPEKEPETWFLSRLAGETQWIVDSRIAANGYCDFSHGFGERYLRVRPPVAEVADVLDRAARDGGHAVEIGRDVALTLPQATESR